MRSFRRLPLDAAVALLLSSTIALFAFGSSSVSQLERIGGPGRWVALLALAALGVAAAARRPVSMPPPWPWLGAASLVALGVVSALWSVDPQLTVGRVFTLAVLFAAAAALTAVTTDPDGAARAVLSGVLAGVAAVALASLALVAVSRGDAILSSTAGAGWRFRGIGQNPNTVAMLLAVGLPVVVWSVFDERGRRRRLTALALLLVVAGEIAVSGSRGALVAGFAGAVVTATALAPIKRLKALSAVGLVVLALACAETTRLQGGALPVTAAQRPTAAATTTRTRGIDAQSVFRLEDELGHPPLGGYRPPVPRTFLGSSGRVQAWDGALRQGAQRPVAGYGFGTEDRVFVDREYAFEGGYVENTYLGLFLQLGAVGVAAFVALLLLLAWCAVQACRRGAGPACAAGGVLVAAVLIGGTQSGLLSVGNIAATTVWFSVLTLPALAAAHR